MAQFAAILLDIAATPSIRVSTFPSDVTRAGRTYSGGAALLDIRWPEHGLGGDTPTLAARLSLTETQATAVTDLGPVECTAYLLSTTDGRTWTDTGYEFTGLLGRATLSDDRQWLIEVSSVAINLLAPLATWTAERQRESVVRGEKDRGLDFLLTVSDREYDWPVHRTPQTA